MSNSRSGHAESNDRCTGSLPPKPVVDVDAVAGAVVVVDSSTRTRVSVSMRARHLPPPLVCADLCCDAKRHVRLSVKLGNVADLSQHG